MIGKMIQRESRVNTRTISVDDYRAKMKLEEKYKRFADLKRRVLAPSIEEVNDMTDVTMDFEVVRSGRTPVAIEITSQTPPRSEPPQPKKPAIERSHEPEPHVEWMSQLEMSERQDVMEKARERARNLGWDDDNERAFNAGVNVALRHIYNERT